VIESFNYDPTFTHIQFPSITVELAVKQLGLFYEQERAFIPQKLLYYYVRVLDAASAQEQVFRVKFLKLGSRGFLYLSRILPFYSHVQELRLWKVGFNEEDVDRLEEIVRGLRVLKVLSLEDMKLQDRGAFAVARGLKNLRSLEELWMSANDISAEGVISLAGALKQLLSLHTICMNFNSMGDEGCAALCGVLAQRSGLKRLELADNQLGGEAGQGLVEVMQKNPDMRVDLSRNEISEDEAKKLLSVCSPGGLTI
jgi:hypothetical protein